MTPETVQKLSKAIDARVRAELAWHDCLNDPRGQRDEHRPVFERVRRARRAVARILEREYNPATYAALNRSMRQAMAATPMAGGGEFK